jgi:hypothetical protein
LGTFQMAGHGVTSKSDRITKKKAIVNIKQLFRV